MRKILSLLMLFCMFVGTAWAQPTEGTVYFLKDKHDTYLDLYKLGKEANDQSKNQLATLSATPQELYITKTTEGDKVYWQIHTKAQGGNYLKQLTGDRAWNTWVSEGHGDFKWEVETTVEGEITYHMLRNISGKENGYLGTDSHTAGQPLYVNNSAEKALKLQLIEKPADAYVCELPEGCVLMYGGKEYGNGEMLIPTGELSENDFTVKVPVGYTGTVDIDEENKKITVNPQIDLTAFADGTKWIFKNKQHQTYMGVNFKGGNLDNTVTPSVHKLGSSKNAYDYKNCWEIKEATYKAGEEDPETSCVQLYNPYYDWYVGKITSRNSAINMAKKAEWAGCFTLENVNGYIVFKCLNHEAEADKNGNKYYYLHQVDWSDYSVVDWNAEADASQWSFQFVTSANENTWFEGLSAEAARTKEQILKYTIGTGLGQYQGQGITQEDLTNAANNIVIPETGSVTEKIKNAVFLMYDNASIIEGLTLNMPTPGFYTVKSLGQKNGMYVQTNAEATGLEFAADKADVRSIVYFGADKTVLSFGTGRYINDYEKIADVGAVAKTWTIAENPKVVGAYSMKWDGQSFWLSDWTGNITYGQNDASAAWMFEEVAELPITISPAGYATFYCPVAVTLPGGLNAYYVSSIANGKAQMPKISEVIPANTGVVLQGEPNPYTLTIGGEADGVTNLLDGTVASTYVELESYVLSQKNDVVGFYKAAMNFAKNGEEPWAKVEENGTHFLNNGFKAYLPASAVTAAGARFITFDFGTETAIDELKGENGNVKTVIYDLSGRRVQGAQKGIFIVNGVKVIK